MTKDRLNDFDIFYQEIPNNDDNDFEIEDLTDEESSSHGLPASQVSRLAQDSIERSQEYDEIQAQARRTNPELFTDDNA